MNRTRTFIVAAAAGLALIAGPPASVPDLGAQAPPSPDSAAGSARQQRHTHMHTHKHHHHGKDAGHDVHAHEHPAVPAQYADAHLPVEVWTDPTMLARGKEIFVARCALCHGDKGDGKGPGAMNLPRKPADLTDAKMVAEMPGNYWFWRVSEGGLAEPFRSQGSAMPAWKGELSVQDRWAVIAYAHTLSGHRGPHVAGEHPELNPKPKLVTGDGTVIALRPEREQIVVEHGEIKGFMEAMTMGYKVNPPALLQRVKAGDKVRFTIDTDERAITKLEKLAP